MSPEDLLNFLQLEQKEAVSLDDALKLIDKYEPDNAGKMLHLFKFCSPLVFL